MDQIERMRKGGRRDPNLPHAFVPTPTDTELLGGAVYRSKACGACGASQDSPIHTDGGGDSLAARRARMADFGE